VALPKTRYARSGDLSIAYQVFGSGEVDLVMAPGFVSHLEWAWQEPGVRHFLERLGSFARLVLFDKRGTGLSDPVAGPGTLEERIDDVRAVMDAAGSARAALFGTSEGGAMAMLFAALHPERISSLILYGTAARWTHAADYPYGRPLGPYLEALDSYVDHWGEGLGLDVFAPSRAEDSALQEWWATMQRMGASPGMARQLFSTYAHLDVRDILDAIHVPTLVIHRRGDRVMDLAHGRYLAEHIPGARWVELDGEDHLPFVGDAEQVVAEIEEFLTGSRPAATAVDRVLATVLFVDVAGSTALAARVGDAGWGSMRARFLAAARHELPRYSGTEVDAAGDGIFATFTGPARAIRCAVAIREAAAAIGLSLRAGVHVGEVALEEGGGVSGLAVHIGARVMAEAEPGEVLVSGTVKDLVIGSGLRFSERGTRILKGVPGSWPVFAVDA
jgi:pimeloyl-ACP methyl ester carboxylesterase